MNRRHFLSSVATAIAGFTILPPATTYQRVWRAMPSVLVPFWYETNLRSRIYSDAYAAALDRALTEASIRGATPQDLLSLFRA